MANLTIKNLPDPVYQHVKAAARRQNRSLNSYLIDLITRDAHWEERRQRMRDSWDDLQKFVASLPPMSDSVEILREIRDGDD